MYRYPQILCLLVAQIIDFCTYCCRHSTCAKRMGDGIHSGAPGERYSTSSRNIAIGGITSSVVDKLSIIPPSCTKLINITLTYILYAALYSSNKLYITNFIGWM